MGSSLKSKAVNGVIWNSVGVFSQDAVRFLIFIILARLLKPEQFGLIGMIAIFIAVANTFLDSGFGQALIQKKDASQSDYSTVFYFNIVIGLLGLILFYISAPLIATFFKEPQLLKLTRFMGLVIIIHSFCLIQNTILTKKIDFKTLTKANFLSVLLGGMVGIILALKGFGVWSLAIQAVSNVSFKTVFLWIFNDWRPTLEFRKSSFNKLFSFGSKLLASSLINTIFNNIYNLVIGKAFSAKFLGYYVQANKLQQYATSNINAVFQNVTFPVFSSIQDENLRLKRGYKTTIKGLVYFNFPLMLGLVVIADPLIRVLLTEKWLPCVPYFQILCLIGLLYPVHSLNLNIIKVKGRSDLFLMLEIVKKIIIIAAVFICLPFGIIALLIGQLATSVISYFLNSYYSGRFIDYGIKEQLFDILPYFISSAAMGLSTWLIGDLVGDHYPIKLLVQIIWAIWIYYVFSKILKLEALKELMSILKNMMIREKLLKIIGK